MLPNTCRHAQAAELALPPRCHSNFQYSISRCRETLLHMHRDSRFAGARAREHQSHQWLLFLPLVALLRIMYRPARGQVPRHDTHDMYQQRPEPFNPDGKDCLPELRRGDLPEDKTMSSAECAECAECAGWVAGWSSSHISRPIAAVQSWLLRLGSEHCAETTDEIINLVTATWDTIWSAPGRENVFTLHH
ncbi:hypothetical protein AC579_4190 [Pseudocercospora musae]|uniref:Uncharacterized protein n=1 Tax=Pseudocercospora musae TaxID=113226 RepID=A0A139IGU5_9PEZI|nr:hypothetical protein AC579_4190 [Pseudocercospora musae]KXT13963.1 hypothetical protein AC579_4190 [Pseudocercospora musae]KXT13964.1 hypothetical protein AC579_4190 [Pseudocercospora musae]